MLPDCRARGKVWGRSGAYVNSAQTHGTQPMGLGKRLLRFGRSVVSDRPVGQRDLRPVPLVLRIGGDLRHFIEVDPDPQAWSFRERGITRRVLPLTLQVA